MAPTSQKSITGFVKMTTAQLSAQDLDQEPGLAYNTDLDMLCYWDISSQVWRRLDDSMPITSALYISGTDITMASDLSFSSSTTTVVPNTLRAFPWLVRRKLPISQARIDVSTLLAGQARFGIYTDVAGAPGDLITNSDSGVFDLGTTGMKANVYASSITLGPGWYWQVGNFSAAAGLRGIPISSISNYMGYENTAGTNRCYTCWSVASAFGALPTSFPAAGRSKVLHIIAPLVMYRVA